MSIQTDESNQAQSGAMVDDGTDDTIEWIFSAKARFMNCSSARIRVDLCNR